MTIEILSFHSSFVNPLLKSIVPILFAIGTVMFYQSYVMYGGNLKKIAFFLVCGGIAGILASAFRWLGDYFVPWKWGESIFLFIFALISILVGYLVFSCLLEIAVIFGMTGEDE